MSRQQHQQQSTAKSVEVAVLGAGVIGLAAGIRLLHEKQVNVTVFSDQTGSETTSRGSGGLWMPYTLGMRNYQTYPALILALHPTAFAAQASAQQLAVQSVLTCGWYPMQATPQATWCTTGPVKLWNICWLYSTLQPGLMLVHNWFRASICGRSVAFSLNLMMHACWH